MIEFIIGIFTQSIPDISIILGNKIVKALFPNGFIEEDSMLSGILGFIAYALLITASIIILMKLF